MNRVSIAIIAGAVISWVAVDIFNMAPKVVVLCIITGIIMEQILQHIWAAPDADID